MNERKHFDLLKTVEYGGCSAKLPPGKLAEVLGGLTAPSHPNLLVGTSTHDDAGVYKVTDDLALVQTTDFFPPICSDAYEFGQIAAANALSDIFAMGGMVLTALNIVMFPQKEIPLEILREMLEGGQDKVHEAGGIVLGGHTIDDYPPKYGLAVTGSVHPDKIIQNSKAKPGDTIILCKPLGTGTIVAGQRLGESTPESYHAALESMKLLNKNAGDIMQKYAVVCGTDITGFGLLGHLLEMAQGSGTSMHVDSMDVPLLEGAYDLMDLGCIPGAAFRNLDYVDSSTAFSAHIDYNRKMLLLDAQTSGGIVMTVPETNAEQILSELIQSGYPDAASIGTVAEKSEKDLYIQ